MTRRGALTRLAATGVALAVAGFGSAAEDDKKKRSTGRIFVTPSREAGERPADVLGTLAIVPEDATWTIVAGPTIDARRVSPDGRTLLALDRAKPLRVWAIDLEEGGEPRKVADLSGYVCWSPDGKQFIVCLPALGGRPTRTWRVDADGSNKVELRVPGTDAVVDWSGRGDWLLTRSERGAPKDDVFRSNAKRSIYLMHPDGSGERLLFEGGYDCQFPRLSPDGRSIVYRHYEGATFEEGKDEGKFSLWMADTEGKSRRPFLKGGDGLSPVQAVWSPDGQQLAVLLNEWPDLGEGDKRTTRNATNRLEIFGADGKRRSRVPTPDTFKFLLCDWR